VTQRPGAGHARRRVGALAVLLLVAGWPAPAFGHLAGPPPSDAPYYETALTGIAPQPPGVTARVAANGDWIELTDTGAAEVVVSGYGGEPYLRVTAAGVWQNDLSPTGYLNQSLFVDTAAITGKPASVAPSWRRIGHTGTVRWHDHRIHWMGVSRPPTVAADPTHRHLIGDWLVRGRAGATQFEIRGTLSWIGKPSRVLGMPALIAVALSVVAGAGVLLTVLLVGSARRRGTGSGGTAGSPPRRSADVRLDLAAGAGRSGVTRSRVEVADGPADREPAK
jgi:hypothetical protein